jgi:hypothetical protein
MTGRTGKESGWAEQDRQTRPTELYRQTGKEGSNRQNRTGKQNMAERNRQNRTGRKGQAERDRQNRKGRT